MLALCAVGLVVTLFILSASAAHANNSSPTGSGGQGSPGPQSNNVVGTIIGFAVIAGIIWFFATRESRSDRVLREWIQKNPSAVTQPQQQPARAVWINGYTRADGTYVPGHYRTAPDGDASNNWSTYPNMNPHTGKPGTR